MKNSMTELMKKHRSIRNFEDRSLPDGLVEELVSCGQRASTSSNLQAYSVIEVSDPERKKELSKLCADQLQIHQSSTFLVFCADLHRDHLAGKIHAAENFDADYVEALLIATVDASLVLQNVALAAESHGLGICMIGAIRNQPKAVGRLLRLPSYVYAVAGLCIGYPAKEQLKVRCFLRFYGPLKAARLVFSNAPVLRKNEPHQSFPTLKTAPHLSQHRHQGHTHV